MKINTLTKKYAIGLAFACGMLMSSSLASANTITILDPVPGGTTIGTVDFVGADGVLVGYIADGVTSNDFAQLFEFSPNNPATEANFFDDLANTDVGAATQVPGGGCGVNCAVSAATEYFSLKFGAGYAFFRNTTGFILALTYNEAPGEGGGLSHVTLYGNRLPISNTPTVPLPAAFPLLLGALGGLTWLSRSRKRRLSA